MFLASKWVYEGLFGFCIFSIVGPILCPLFSIVTHDVLYFTSSSSMSIQLESVSQIMTRYNSFLSFIWWCTRTIKHYHISTTDEVEHLQTYLVAVIQLTLSYPCQLVIVEHFRASSNGNKSRMAACQETQLSLRILIHVTRHD